MLPPEFGGTAGEALQERLNSLPDEPVAITVITVEEQLRGWLARVHAQRTAAAQICRTMTASRP